MAVAVDERSPTLPDIPTIAEAGLPGFRSITWFAIVGPPAMSAALAARINRDVVDILQRPAVSAKLRDLRLDPMIGTPADAAKFFAEETELWRDRTISSSTSCLLHEMKKNDDRRGCPRQARA
jgi:tripartite-type tricarboxylate transporter receptor subunit TctC